MKTSMAVVVLLLVSPWPGSERAAPSEARAFATFQIAHGNQCTKTTAAVEVTGSPAIVVFHYDVFGQPLSPGCDGLWYYFIDGSAPLNDGEFVVAPNRKSAHLQKTLDVYDDEGGVTFEVLLEVTWTVSQGGGPPVTLATLSVKAPQIEAQYTINPLPLSSSAAILRLKPGKGPG